MLFIAQKLLTETFENTETAHVVTTCCSDLDVCEQQGAVWSSPTSADHHDFICAWTPSVSMHNDL